MKIVRNVPRAFVFLGISVASSAAFMLIALGVLFYIPNGFFEVLVEESGG